MMLARWICLVFLSSVRIVTEPAPSDIIVPSTIDPSFKNTASAARGASCVIAKHTDITVSTESLINFPVS
jgi:hypothetical protein